jgi:hypothetical protein
VAEPTVPPPARSEGLWLWGLAALVLLAIVIVLGVRACDDDKGAGNTGTPIVTEGFTTVATTTPSVTKSVTTAPSLTDSVPETNPGGPEPDPPALPPPNRRGGTLMAGSQDLYPALAGSLTKFANQQAIGSGVTVVSVVGKESFWAGRSRTQRLLVVINLKGEAPPKVRAGQAVDFTGEVLANKGDYGVTEPDGKALLERHGHHVFVSAQDLKAR